ncbi:hypothetical protein MAR_003740 [Mya arenaria]|uniref:Uncharacterized protein n=1 Tax=Mya arenaria TaxID=6604 RepID=A0ABY7G6W5_MYAAR|nr:hypothetical protein MAR_003740 [Mya arenaria]
MVKEISNKQFEEEIQSDMYAIESPISEQLIFAYKAIHREDITKQMLENLCSECTTGQIVLNKTRTKKEEDNVTQAIVQRSTENGMITSLRVGCIEFTIHFNSFDSCLQFLEDVVSAKVAIHFKPLVKVLRELFGNKRLELDVSVPEDQLLECFANICNYDLKKYLAGVGSECRNTRHFQQRGCYKNIRKYYQSRQTTFQNIKYRITDNRHVTAGVKIRDRRTACVKIRDRRHAITAGLKIRYRLHVIIAGVKIRERRLVSIAGVNIKDRRHVSKASVKIKDRRHVSKAGVKIKDRRHFQPPRVYADIEILR